MQPLYPRSLHKKAGFSHRHGETVWGQALQFAKMGVKKN
jgi:hypothetical protein